MNWKVTIDCINSIYSNTQDVNFHIYLVDNASPNNPPNKIREFSENENFTFISSNVNKGYSAGNNIGIKKALEDGCELFLISNSDIVFKENSILLLSKYLNNNPDVGIVGPKLLNLDGQAERPSMCIKTGIKEKYLVRTGLRKIFRSLANTYYGDNLTNYAPSVVHSVSGSCFMLSRKCIIEITPFDENTFLYEEELIIGVIMERKGYKTIYNPECSVIHAHGQSTKEVKSFSFICFVESEIYYCKEYLGMSLLTLLPLYIIRCFSYIYRSLKSRGFRKDFFWFFKKTLPMLLN